MAASDKKNSIFWFRRDLRIQDNEALSLAARESDTLICLYIYAPEEESPWEPGAASKWWLHHALTDLSASIESLGSKLIIRSGKSLDILESIIEKFSIDTVYWNRLYDPATISRDTAIKKHLTEKNIHVRTFSGSLLKEPWEIKNASGAPYQVFTPFWKALSKEITSFENTPTPGTLPAPAKYPVSESVSSLRLLPSIPWDKEFYDTWNPSESGAWKALDIFLNDAIDNYKEKRDFPSIEGTSRLSPWLHFGQISAGSIWNRVQHAFQNSEIHSPEPFLRQLGWRDFAHHLLYHFPHTDLKPLKKEFASFPWKKNKRALTAWQKGQTGIPIIDAGMRELWKTGIMHNRVRMIAGSLLVKNLLIHWHEGAKWFWDTLVDADLANNSLGWQWIAGSGADAAPYFRIFNPLSQSARFDPEGSYIRRWVPELASLPDKWIFRPWDAPDHILEAAGVRLGVNYPQPVCDLRETRENALEAYSVMKKGQ
jgi:deoxyribodipyrimidine photo-lyase